MLQLGKVNRLLLAGLACRAPLLPGAEVLAFIDLDSMQKRVFGHAKQGAGFGYTKIQGKSLLVRGLNVLAGFLNCVAGSDLRCFRLASDLHAACSYSLIRPPRTPRRCIFAVVRSVMAAGGLPALLGGRRLRARCGRCRL